MSTNLLPYADKLDPWSSHSLILRWLLAMPAGTRVLDIGTATGTIGRACQAKGFELFGIEPEPAWAEVARPYYQQIQLATLDAVSDDYLAGYNVIILADVLEHMPAPLLALKRLVGLQEADALFLISVPNIANLYIRLHLLMGKFDYTERGILDRTHLRFFTRRTLMALLQQAGLLARQEAATPIPLNLVHPFFEQRPAGKWLHSGLAGLTRRLPTLLGYQFVVQCVRA